ncbi:putative haloacid dehalogenase-like hydrolase [Virgisporangium aliadipatigenens]|uniref:Putative haloacid dehalogenase-like hydrolase n=1 Tax=Virgisporangium aliadipatigenens TaxID=741659 RepID=A0A8J4DQF6_9ACTN|nr:phosphonatase-like hydrolase [Virgisporangium aliadipatigenens]GIJ45658.1 putative haloacid dehalogenase-like hydrolase [Virgisporangium aliadipatigenens]
MRWQLACLGMAGTTIRDGGLVEQAVTVAVAGQGVVPGTAEHERMLAVVRKTMGRSNIEVFRLLLDGDERRARAANAEFEQAYGLLVDDGAIEPVPGVVEAISTLRESGVKVALTTGFARSTQNAVLDALGWHGLIDLALSPADAGRGRPYPDLVLVAALRLGVEDVARIAVAGDTPLDVIAGRRAGAGLVAGVLTGAADATELRAAGATTVIDSVAGLPALMGVGRPAAVYPQAV